MADTDLRQLIQESRQIKVPIDDLLQKQRDEPMGRSQIARVWSAIAERPKTAQRLEQDYRTSYILKRLSDQYPDGNVPGLAPVQQDMVREYAKDSSPWEQSYEPAAGSYPLYNTLQWSMSMPSAIYATGEMVGNEVHKALAEDEHAAKRVPYPDAYQDYEYAVNTLTGGATDAAGLLPKGQSYWHDVAGVREEQERMARKYAPSFAPSGVMDESVANLRHGKMREMMDGEDFINRSTLPSDKLLNPTVAALAGPLMDGFLSYPSSLGPATNSLLARKGGEAAAEIASDYGMATAHLWGPAAIDYLKSAPKAVTEWHAKPPVGYGWYR